MNREKDFIKNTFILGLGRFLPKLVSIVTLPIVTACLTKSEYGTYDLISTLISLLLPIATLQIQSAAFRFLIECRGNHNKSSEIISNVYAVVFPVSLIVSLAVIAFAKNLSIPVRIVTGLYFLFDSIRSTLGMVVRGLGKNKVYAINSVVYSIVNGIGIVLAVQLKNQGLFGLILSLAIANLLTIVFLSFNIKIWQYLNLKVISGSIIREMLLYSWPMVPNNLSNWVLSLSDRLIITGFLGIEANAVYAVATKIPNLLSTAHGVLTMSWQENASIAVNDEDAADYYTKIFDNVFSLLIGFTALIIGFMPLMFRLLIRGDYGESYNQMPILIFGQYFSAMAGFMGGIYIAHKRTKHVGYTTMAAAAINLIINLLLIRRINITAGSISTLIAYLALYIFRVKGTQKFQPMDFKINKQLLSYFMVLLMGILCYQKSIYLNIINGIIGVVFFLFLNWNFVKRITNSTLQVFRK